MKKLKCAFTLAEALITIAIIGVIASITLPTLNSNIQKSQVGPSLAKAINTLQNANDLALQAGGVRTLDQLTPNDNTKYFEDGLKNRVAWAESSIPNAYTKFSTNSNFELTNVNKMYVSKDGIAFMQVEAAPQGVVFIKDPLTGKSGNGNYKMYSYNYYTVYVDINGNNKGPNKLGKDLFCLYVDTKGSVIPAGGAEWKGYGDVKPAANMNQMENAGLMMGAGDNKKTSSHDCPNVDASACAGLIVDSGYKVTYY